MPEDNETGVQIDTDLSSKQKNDEAKDPRQGLPASVAVEEASGPMKLDDTKRVDPAGQYIQYDGVALVRIMDEDGWNAVNVESDEYFEWNYLNSKRIPRSSFSDEQLQYLLRVDGRFSLVNVDSEGKVKEDEKVSETTK